MMEQLAELIAKARRERKWLFVRSISTGPMWFSPDQLAAENAHGSFRWSVENWTLRDPQEALDEAEGALVSAQNRRNRIAEEILKGRGR